MASEVEKQELLSYLRKISSFQTQQIKTEYTIVSKIWGIILIIAGIFDLIMVLTSGIYPSFVHWSLLIFLAYYIQQMIVNEVNTLPADLDQYRAKINWNETIIVALMFSSTFFLYKIGEWTIIPVISLIMGLINLHEYHTKPSPFPDVKQASFYSMSLFFISTIILTMILIVGGTDLGIYNGLIFGLITGIGNYTLGVMYSRKQRLRIM